MAYIPHRRRHQACIFSGFSISTQTKKKLYKLAIPIFIGLLVFGYLLVLAVFAWYGRGLPEPGKLSDLRGNSTIFYDRNDKVIYEMFKDKNRIQVDVKDISKYVQQATVAIEDKRFYEHKGVSEYGIIRAMVSSVLGSPQGGSTITQQLIKNVLLTSERSLSRKVKEAILAYEVEKRYTKSEILGMYLNEAPYGGSFWGVGSAAMGYFGKQPSELNILESAFIAGLPQQPSYYSPFIGEKDAWKARTKDVLRRMREDDYITKDQEKQAVAGIDKLKFSSSKLAINAPHFIFYLKNEIEDKLGVGILDRGVKVYTTLDLEVQKKAEEIVKKDIVSLKSSKVGNGALVAVEPDTGDIIAYVGSYDYNNEKYGKYDVVSQGLRQPGSALKPIEYAVSFEKGYTPSTVIMDVKTTFPNQGDKDYIPENYDSKFRGPVQIRFALGNSFNVPAVKMLAMIGLQDFLAKAYDMGLTTLEPTQETLDNLGLSASLGGGETRLIDMVQAYGVFANSGNKVSIEGVKVIKEFNGKKLYSRGSLKEKQVLSKEISFLISHILSDNNARSEAFGSYSLLNIPGRTVAVKTGTTNDKRDNWAIGFTKSITLGVWVGNNDNSPMDPVIASGTTGASSIWNAVMKELLKTYDDGIMNMPSNVKALEIDAYLGGLPKDGYPKRSEYFIEGSEPKEISPYYKKLKISKSNGKLANDVEIKSGNYEEKDFIVVTETDPVSTDGKNRWQEAIDEWAKAQSDAKYHYPTETSDSNSDNVIVSIKSPSNETTVDTNEVEINAKITSIESVREVKIWINGEEKKVISGDNKEIKEKFTLEKGKYEIKIQAWNTKDKSGDSTIKIGVQEPWKSE